MDRFIVKEKAEKQVVDVYLKSNMDRFIDQTKIEVIQGVFI